MRAFISKTTLRKIRHHLCFFLGPVRAEIAFLALSHIIGGRVLCSAMGADPPGFPIAVAVDAKCVIAKDYLLGAIGAPLGARSGPALHAASPLLEGLLEPDIVCVARLAYCAARLAVLAVVLEVVLAVRGVKLCAAHRVCACHREARVAVLGAGRVLLLAGRAQFHAIRAIGAEIRVGLKRLLRSAGLAALLLLHQENTLLATVAAGLVLAVGLVASGTGPFHPAGYEFAYARGAQHNNLRRDRVFPVYVAIDRDGLPAHTAGLYRHIGGCSFEELDKPVFMLVRGGIQVASAINEISPFDILFRYLMPHI